MLNFVQNIQYYMMFEVMEPTWHVMENNLKTVSDSLYLMKAQPAEGSFSFTADALLWLEVRTHKM